MRKRWETAGKMVIKCWENEDYLEIEGEHAGMMWKFNEIQWDLMGNRKGLWLRKSSN